MSDDLTIVKPIAPFYPDGVPAKLRQYNNWILWRYEYVNDKWTKIPINANGLYPCRVIDANCFSSFEFAVTTFFANRSTVDGVGFCLTAADPFTFIDLDDAEGDAQLESTHTQICARFADTYAETSPSGKGLHIIVEGDIGKGRRTKGVELYSVERYMTVTGNSINNCPIVPHQQDLDYIIYEINNINPRNSGASCTHISKPAMYSEDDLIARASSHRISGAKFQDLFIGGYDKKKYPEYPSQSEADQAFLNMVGNVTENHDQLVSIFFRSALGQRAKARERFDDYVVPMLNKVYDKHTDQITDAQANSITANLLNRGSVALADVQSTASLHGTDQVQSTATAEGNGSEPLTAQQEQLEQDTEDDTDTSSDNEWVPTRPPGLMGEIADYIYASAYQQVPHAALAGAMALMAGIAGRAYNFNGGGCNLYILYLAQTGTGKDAGPSGINKIIGAVADGLNGIRDAHNFIGPSVISSAPALIKALDKSNSFVSMIGEFGVYQKATTGKFVNTNSLQLDKAILDLFNKSAHGDTMNGVIYSETIKNVEPIKSPAFSLFGESTPQTYYENLTVDSVTGGYVGRFITIEYKGKRKYSNQNRLTEVPEQLVERVKEFIVTAKAANNAPKPYIVSCTDDAHILFKQFDNYCTDQGNKDRDETIAKGLWARALQKAMRLAALVAAGCHFNNPCITYDIALWAIQFIDNDIIRIASKFSRNEIGDQSTGAAVSSRFYRYVYEFYTRKFKDMRAYQIKKEHHTNGFMTKRYLQMRMAANSKLSVVERAREYDAVIKEAIDVGAIRLLTLEEKNSLQNAIIRSDAYIVEDMEFIRSKVR